MVTVEITGGRRVDRQFLELTVGLRNRLMKKALREAAKMIRREARSELPRKSKKKKTTGALKRSIRHRVMRRSRKRFGYEILPLGDLQGKKYPWAVNWGALSGRGHNTVTPRREYLTRALEKNIPRIKSAIESEIRAGLRRIKRTGKA